MSKILKNTTITDIELDIAGITVPASGQITVPTETYSELASEDSVTELTPLINSGDIVVNDSISDLPAVEGINYIKYANFAESIRLDSSSFISNEVKGALEELASQPGEEFCVFPIWAEENAGISNGQREWSFGNGATGDIGIVVPFDAQIIAVSYNADTAGTNSEVAVVINTSTQIATTGPQSGEDGFNLLGSPVSISAGDRLGFQTITGGGASDVRVCAWLRVPSSLAIDLALGELNDVILTAPSNGQALIYNGTQWVNQTLPSAPVDSVNGQTGVVVLDADDIDDSLTTNKFATQAELDQIATNTSDISTNISNIATNTSNISTNTGNIGTNASNIATNSANIATNTSDITTLENRNINTTAPIQGGGNLTADRTISLDINSAPSDTITAADEIIYGDVSDSNNTKKTTISALVSLVPAAPVDSVNGQTGVVVLDADDIDDSVTTNKFATQAELDQIAANTSGISTNASNIATNAADISTNTANIATNASNISTNTSNIATNTVNIATNTADIASNDADILELELNQDDLVALSGVPENSTNLGTFTGTTIPDNQNNKQAMQSLETGLETHISDTANPHNTTFTQAVAADPATDITAAEAEELTNGSTTQLHDHRELVDETSTNRVEVLNGGDIQISNYPQTRNDTTSNDEKVLTTDNSGNVVLRRVLPFYASIKKISDAVSEIGINQTTTLEDWLILNVNIPETGNYDIDWTYVWSFNDGGQDFEAQILLDGSPISTYSEHIQEPKDTAGTGVNLLNTTGGITNSGTDQRHRTSGFEPERNLTAGPHTVTIQWAGSQSNDEATIYEGAIRIKRVS